MKRIAENMYQNAEYPNELVEKCKENPYGIARRSAYTKEMKNWESTEPTLFEAVSPKSDTLYDTFDITKFSMLPQSKGEGEKMGELKAYVSLVNNSPHIHIEADILDTNKKLVVAHLGSRDMDNSNYLEISEKFDLDTGVPVDNLEAIVHATWEENGVKDTVSMVAVLNIPCLPIHYVHVRPKKELSVVIIGTPEPVNPNDHTHYEPSSDHIVLALVRKPSEMKTVDYMCGLGRTGPKNLPAFGVPGNGIFMGPQGAQPLLELTSAICVVGPRGGGGKTIAANSTYTSGINTIQFSKNGSNLVYDMQTSWGCPYEDADKWVKTEFDYDLRINYGYSSQGHTYFMMDHITSMEGDYLYKVLPLFVMYGCLAGETLIKMEDGSWKEIKDIRIGERVIGKEGNGLRVKNVWSGTEPIPMILLETHNGKSLLLTESHPVITETGIVKAKDITQESKVLNEEKEWVNVGSISRKEYQESIYNLDLENEEESEGNNKHFMLAGGIWVGDNQLQNEMEVDY